MSNNQFHGHIPISIANASNLRSFQAAQNYLSGTLPSNIGGLQGLQRLVLYSNLLQVNEPKDWNFMTALTNCSELLDLNDVVGELPPSLSNLSTSLEKLTLSGNQISGVLPQNIDNLIGLETLALELNNLTGPLPSSLSMIPNLQYLSLYSNNFWGDLLLIGNLTQLNYLYIGYNSFNGTVPTTLGNLKSLLEFNLSRNKAYR
jgi:Leucine-rich repeat (LRR) protein